jgi:predicted Fe-Mo cluster-binding NifX family protein
MKAAVTAKSPSLDSVLDSRFGRCHYFVIVDTDTGEFDAVKNEAAELGSGAGVQSARMLASKGVQQLLTGACGPNAIETLQAAGIQVVSGCSGTVRQVLRNGAEEFPTAHEPAAGPIPAPPRFDLPTARSPAVAEQQRGYGMRSGRGAGRGSGKGRGPGRGMGRGGAGRGPGGGRSR